MLQNQVSIQIPAHAVPRDWVFRLFDVPASGKAARQASICLIWDEPALMPAPRFPPPTALDIANHFMRLGVSAQMRIDRRHG